MATTIATNRRRIGRTLRRTRGATAAAEAAAAAATADAKQSVNGRDDGRPLRAIEENTIVDLTLQDTAPTASSHFSRSPPLKKPTSIASSTAADPLVKKQTTSAATTVAGGGSKRKREALAESVSSASASSSHTRSKSHRARGATSKSSTRTGKKPSASTTEALNELERKTQRATQLLEELERQLDKRCADLVAEAERKAEELRMELKVQLMFLPESVRAMAWRTFIEDFGGSLENVIQNVKEQDYINYVTSQQGLAAVASPKSALKIRTAPATVRSKDRRSHGGRPSTGLSTPAGNGSGHKMRTGRFSIFQTPSCTPMGADMTKTILRTARKGETTYSIHGSPIAPDTVVKAPAGSLVATLQDDSEALACITLDNDTAVDLSHPDQLNDETKAQARAKLEALQAKVNALLRQFK